MSSLVIEKTTSAIPHLVDSTQESDVAVLTSQLEGVGLSFAVARAVGLQVAWRVRDGLIKMVLGDARDASVWESGARWAPAHDVAQAHAFLADLLSGGMSLQAVDPQYTNTLPKFKAIYVRSDDFLLARGDTPEQAFLRYLVLSRLGETVRIPAAFTMIPSQI